MQLIPRAIEERGILGLKLALLENGFAFLHEGPRGFFGVFTAREFVRHVLFKAVAVTQIHELDGIHRVLGQADGERAFRGYVLR
jgi:hypothetical protein